MWERCQATTSCFAKKEKATTTYLNVNQWEKLRIRGFDTPETIGKWPAPSTPTPRPLYQDVHAHLA